MENKGKTWSRGTNSRLPFGVNVERSEKDGEKRNLNFLWILYIPKLESCIVKPEKMSLHRPIFAHSLKTHSQS